MRLTWVAAIGLGLVELFYRRSISGWMR